MEILLAFIIIPLIGVSIPALIYGIFSALGRASRGFIKAVYDNIKFHDLQRSYFFGPGFAQLKRVWSSTFAELGKETKSAESDWMIDGEHKVNSFWEFFYDINILCIYGFGSLIAVIFCLALSLIFAAVAAVFFIFFAPLWLMDRLYLVIKSISCRCPNCKRSFIVPAFKCPKCGAVYKNLTPGSHGIFHRLCSCGYKLPMTIFNGRAKLKSLCPYCETDIVTSDASQFGIQIVGDTSTGKTTYLAAFWHVYIKNLKSRKIYYKISPKDKFAELENFYKHGLSTATDEHNASMYSVIHKFNKNSSCQLSLYDIAGEAFLKLDEDKQQLHFSYCEGIIFIIDPTNSPHAVRESFAGFINEFKNLKNLSADKISNIPAAVIISKSDLFNKEIGLVKIKTKYNKQTQSLDFDDIRNKTCRDFLIGHAFTPAVNLIEAEFKNINYFPVSAMGHNLDGTAYEPWGVLEPVLWIFKEADSVLYKLYI